MGLGQNLASFLAGMQQAGANYEAVKERESKLALNDMEMAYKKAQIAALENKEVVQRQQEEAKRLQEAASNIGQVANLQKQFDEYIGALAHTVDQNYLLRNVPYTEANKEWNRAQNIKGRIIGKLSEADNLGKTQGILHFFDEKMNVKSSTSLEGLREAFNSQLQNIVVAEADKAGLSGKQGLELFKSSFENQFSNPRTEEAHSKATEEKPLKEDKLIASENLDNKELPLSERLRLQQAFEDQGGSTGSPQSKEPIKKDRDYPGFWDSSGFKLFNNDLVKSIPEGIGHVGKSALKFLVPDFEYDFEGEKRSMHENLDKVVAPKAEKAFRNLVNIENPDSSDSKVGRFIGEAGGYTALSPGRAIPGIAGAMADGAFVGMLEDPENPIKGGAIGAAAGGFLHKSLGAISAIPQSAKKWWLKWRGGKSKNTLETSERLSNYFSSDEVSLGQLLNNPKMIQTERTMGHVPFSGTSKTVDAMIGDLEKISSDIGAAFEKNATLTSQEILALEANLKKTSQKLYQEALGKEANDLVLSPKEAHELIMRKYANKPDVKQFVDEVEAFSNEEVRKIWNANHKILENLWKTNKEAYTNLYRELQLPNFWDLHWFNSELKYKSHLFKNKAGVESKTRAGMHNDLKTTSDIIKSYGKQKEYKAATDNYREIVAPFKDNALKAFHQNIQSGKTSSYDFFTHGGDSAKKVYSQLSDQAKKDVLAGVIDPEAQNLSLRSFKEMVGGRGNKATSKADHLLTPQQRVQFEDYGQLNRMLTDLQPEQKAPQTGKAILHAIKNPVAFATTLGSSFYSLPGAIGLGSGMSINRQLAKSLRNRKNLKYYMKPELLDEIIQKKQLKHRHRLPTQVLKKYKKEER